MLFYSLISLSLIKIYDSHLVFLSKSTKNENEKENQAYEIFFKICNFNGL